MSVEKKFTLKGNSIYCPGFSLHKTSVRPTLEFLGSLFEYCDNEPKISISPKGEIVFSFFDGNDPNGDWAFVRDEIWANLT